MLLKRYDPSPLAVILCTGHLTNSCPTPLNMTFLSSVCIFMYNLEPADILSKPCSSQKKTLSAGFTTLDEQTLTGSIFCANPQQFQDIVKFDITKWINIIAYTDY